MWKLLLRLKYIICVLAMTSSNAAVAAEPFTCTGNIYQVQRGQLRIFDAISSTYVDIGSDGSNYNAIGYNQNDNFLYGIKNEKLIQIDANGDIVEIMDVGFDSSSGDMDNNNQLWVKGAESFVVINVETQNINIINVDSSFFPSGSSDFVFVDTAIGQRIIQIGRSNMTMYDPATGTNIVKSVADLPNVGTTGAAWADLSGRVFFFKNKTGDVYELFDYLTPNPRAVLVSVGVVSGNNDGASCRAADFPNLAPLAFDDEFRIISFNSVSGNLLDDNGSGADNDPDGSALIVNTTLIQQPADGSVILNADGSFTYTPNPSFFGSDSFIYEIADSSGTTARATVNIIELRAELEVEKQSQIFEAVSFTQFALPENDVIYTITVRNIGTGPTDVDTLFVVDEIPANIQFFNDDIDSGSSNNFSGSHAIGFIDNDSGTDFDPSRDVRYSNSDSRPSSFSDCNYTPEIGYDPNVKYICINPKGQMATDDVPPSFSLSFRARID